MKGWGCHSKGLRLHIEDHSSILERSLWQQHGEWIERVEVAESESFKEAESVSWSLSRWKKERIKTRMTKK